MGVMCSTSQCELRSTFPNLRVTNVIRIVTFYTLPPLESPTSSWMTRSQRSRRRDKGLSLLLYEPYANESSQIWPFLARRPQFESVHHQNRRLSSHSYSHESVIFSVFLELIFFKLRRVCVFFSLTARGYVQPLTTDHCGSVHYITIGDSRLLSAAGLARSPLYFIGDAASRCGLSRVGYYIPLNGRCPLNGHPPSEELS